MKLPRRPLLLAFPVVLALAALAGAWLFRPRLYLARGVETPCIFVPPGREHQARPGCSGISRAGGLSAEMRFNDIGLRDRDYPPRPAKGVVRVLFLGASNVLGVGVKEEESLPRQLERALRVRKIPAEVINGATVGYCTTQAAMRLRELMERYSPHVLLYDLNWGGCPLFDGAWQGRLTFEGGLPASLDRFPLGFFPASWRARVYASPSLFFFLLTIADQLRKAEFSWRVAKAGPPAAKAAAYLGPTLQLLEAMGRHAGTKGARFVVTAHLMPRFTQSVPTHFYQGAAQLLSHLVVDPKLGAEDIFSEVRARGFTTLGPFAVPRKTLIAGDEHYGPEGYRWLAETMAKALAQGSHLRK